MPNAHDTLAIAPVSQYLASNAISKASLFGGVSNAPRQIVPQRIWVERETLAVIYAGNNNYPGIQPAADYLYAMLYHPAQASGIVNNNNGGNISPITPVPGGGSGSGLFRLLITNSNLDGNAFNDPRLIGKNYNIFISNYNEELLYAPADFIVTATGFIITAAGFDPATYDYKIMIEEYTPVAGSIITLATPTNIVRSFGPGFTEVKYDWDDVLHATGYVWQLASDFSFTAILASGTVGVSQVLITLGSAAPPLYFRVYATAPGYAQSGYGSLFFTPGAFATPVISFTNITTSSFDVNWTPATNANQFNIDIALDASFATIVASGSGSNTGVYSFLGGVVDTTYYVRVMQSASPAWYIPSDYGLGNQGTARIFDNTFDNTFN